MDKRTFESIEIEGVSAYLNDKALLIPVKNFASYIKLARENKVFIGYYDLLRYNAEFTQPFMEYSRCNYENPDKEPYFSEASDIAQAVIEEFSDCLDEMFFEVGIMD